MGQRHFTLESARDSVGANEIPETPQLGLALPVLANRSHGGREFGIRLRETQAPMFLDAIICKKWGYIFLESNNDSGTQF